MAKELLLMRRNSGITGSFSSINYFNAVFCLIEINERRHRIVGSSKYPAKFDAPQTNGIYMSDLVTLPIWQTLDVYDDILIIAMWL